MKSVVRDDSAMWQQLQVYARDLRVAFDRERRARQELQATHMQTVQALAAAVAAKDDVTGGHIQRVHALALLIARRVCPAEADDPQMAYGFLLHDIGKLAVPDSVLLKPGPLDDDEWTIMRRHPQAGVDILSSISYLQPATVVVLHHHERWDGKGYPARLRGDAIPLWARIFAIADTVDAMTAPRPYRPALPYDVAREEIARAAGTQFDPRCARAFLELEPEAVLPLLAHAA